MQCSVVVHAGERAATEQTLAAAAAISADRVLVGTAAVLGPPRYDADVVVYLPADHTDWALAAATVQCVYAWIVELHAGERPHPTLGAVLPRMIEETIRVGAHGIYVWTESGWQVRVHARSRIGDTAARIAKALPGLPFLAPAQEAP